MPTFSSKDIFGEDQTKPTGNILSAADIFGIPEENKPVMSAKEIFTPVKPGSLAAAHGPEIPSPAPPVSPVPLAATEAPAGVAEAMQPVAPYKPPEVFNFAQGTGFNPESGKLNPLQALTVIGRVTDVPGRIVRQGVFGTPEITITDPTKRAALDIGASRFGIPAGVAPMAAEVIANAATDPTVLYGLIRGIIKGGTKAAAAKTAEKAAKEAVPEKVAPALGREAPLPPRPLTGPVSHAQLGSKQYEYDQLARRIRELDEAVEGGQKLSPADQWQLNDLKTTLEEKGLELDQIKEAYRKQRAAEGIEIPKVEPLPKTPVKAPIEALEAVKPEVAPPVAAPAPVAPVALQPARGSAGAMVSAKMPPPKAAPVPKVPVSKAPPVTPPTAPAPAGSALEEARRVVTPAQPAKVRFIERTRGFVKGVQTAVTSEFTPMREIQRKIYRAAGKEVPETDLAREFEHLPGAQSKAQADLIEFDRAVVSKIKDRPDDFNAFLFLKRTESRLLADPKAKRVGTWTAEKAQQGLEELRGQVGDQAFNAMQEAADNYQQQMDNALRLQVTSGRMSEGLYQRIKDSNDFYAPFKVMKYFDPDAGLAGTGRNIENTSDLAKRIVGIDSADFTLGDILHESAKQIYRSRILAEKNLKMLELAKLTEVDELGQFIKKAQPTRYFQIEYKPAEEILDQLGLQQTARNPQLLEQSFVKVGRAIELADEVGLKLKKKNLPVSLGRATRGGVQKLGGVVNLKAFTSEVVAHELGHSFDVQLGPRRYLSSAINDRKLVESITGKKVPFGKRSVFQNELTEVVNASGLGGSEKYRNSAVERFAAFMDMYIHNPKQTRSLAPTWTNYFETDVLPKQKIKTLVERLGAFYQKVDKLPNIMTPLKEMDNHNYLELAIRRAFPDRKPQVGVRFGTKAQPGFEVVNYLDKGVEKGLQVPRDVAKAIEGLNVPQASIAAKIMSASAKPLRWGATAFNAAFQPVNLFFADLPRLALISRYGLKKTEDVFRFPADVLYSFYTSLRGNFGKPNDLYMDFLKSGAANSTIQRELTPGVFQKAFGIGKQSALRKGERVIESIAQFSNAIEETSKIAGLKRGFRLEGIDKLSPEQATERLKSIVTEVRNYAGSPDFARRGTVSSGRNLDNLNLLFMFFNARVQGTASDMARLAGRTGTKEARAAWGRLTTAVALPALGLALYNKLPGNREDYEKVPEWERSNYFMIPRDSYFTNERGETVRNYWRIPKREIVKLYSNLIESGVDFADKKDPQALGNFALNFLENIAPVSIEGKGLKERGESVISSLNPAIKTPVELLTNRDTYRHRPVVPDYIEGVESRRLPASEQYTRTTPEAYKKIGKAAGVSPIALEHGVRSATAGLVSQFAPGKVTPGRSKVLGMPVIGNVARRFVRSESLAPKAGQGEELDKELVEQGTRQVTINRQARDIAEQLSSISTEEKARRLFKIRAENKILYERVKDLLNKQSLDLSSDERKLGQLGVENQARAQYLVGIVKDMPTEERTQYLSNLRRKKILTDKVALQLQILLRSRKAVNQ